MEESRRCKGHSTAQDDMEGLCATAVLVLHFRKTMLLLHTVVIEQRLRYYEYIVMQQRYAPLRLGSKKVKPRFGRAAKYKLWPIRH